MPMTTRATSRLTTALLASPLWLTTATVLAQSANAPPSPTLQRTQSPLLGFGLMFLLTAIVIAVSLMPSKRSHQD
jgi:hypothetical protein